jgi:hypothetical protein
LLRVRVSARLGATELALDPFTRKMEVAEAAVSTLTGQLDRDRDTVVVFTPPGFGRPISVNTGKVVTGYPAGVPYYDLVQGVLGGGVVLRLFEPRLDSIVFVDRWTPAYRDFDLFTKQEGGHLVRLGRGVRSHSRFAGAMLGNGYDAEAREYLSEVIRVYPEDRLTRLLYAAALSRTGEPDSARANARLLLEGGESDTLAATARRLISILDAKK